MVNTESKLVTNLKLLKKNLTKNNVQSTLRKVSDLYNDDYLLADDNLYSLFNYTYNILSYGEAYSAFEDDDNPANGKDVMRDDEKALNWLDNHDDLDFVHWTDVQSPITVKQAKSIIDTLIENEN